MVTPCTDPDSVADDGIDGGGMTHRNMVPVASGDSHQQDPPGLALSDQRSSSGGRCNEPESAQLNGSTELRTRIRKRRI